MNITKTASVLTEASLNLERTGYDRSDVKHGTYSLILKIPDEVSPNAFIQFLVPKYLNEEVTAMITRFTKVVPPTDDAQQKAVKAFVEDEDDEDGVEDRGDEEVDDDDYDEEQDEASNSVYREDDDEDDDDDDDEDEEDEEDPDDYDEDEDEEEFEDEQIRRFEEMYGDDISENPARETSSFDAILAFEEFMNASLGLRAHPMLRRYDVSVSA